MGTTDVVTVDGVEVATRDYQELPELADGRHELVLTSTSETGDSSTDSVTFEVDTTGTTLTFSPPGGEYSTPQEVTVSASESAVIYWTDDPADPGPVEETGSAYNGNPLWVTSDRTIRAVAVDGAGNVSATATATFSVRLPSKLRPEILSPADRLITADQTPVLAYVIRDADGHEVSDPNPQVTVAVDGREVVTRSGEALDALDDGLHTIDVDATNDAGTSHTSVDIVVDSAGALVAYDQDDSHLRFQGPWQRVSGPSHSDGAEMALDGQGAVLVGFEGTMITVHGTMGPGMGTARVTIDDVTGVVDLYAPEERANQLLCARALPPGEHALKMEWTGERCADSSGALVAIDGIRVAGTLSEAPNPLTVVPTLDGTGAVSALISAEAGGSLEAVGSDGTLYRLDLPSGAFLEDTDVSMRPIASVGGAPMSGGLIGGVELEPSGVSLVVPATLRVTPPDAPSGDYLTVGFGYQLGGKEFHLKEAFITGDAIEIPIAHFSGFGLGMMTVSDVIAMQQNHAPTDPAAKMEQEVVNGDVVASAEKLRVKAVQALGLAEKYFRCFPEARNWARAYLDYLRYHRAMLPYRDLAFPIQSGLRDIYWQCMQSVYVECGQMRSVQALASLYRWYRYRKSDWQAGYFDLISDAVTESDLAHWGPKIQASDKWSVWCGSGRERYGLRISNLAEPPSQRNNMEARVALQLAATDASQPVEGTGSSVERTTFLSKWRYDEGWYWYEGRLTLDHGFESPVDLVVTLQPFLLTWPEYGREPLGIGARLSQIRQPELDFAIPWVPGRFAGLLESWEADREDGFEVDYRQDPQTLPSWETMSYAPPPEGPDDFFDTPDGAYAPGASWVTRIREWDQVDDDQIPFASKTYTYIKDDYNDSWREATHFKVDFCPPAPTE